MGLRIGTNYQSMVAQRNIGETGKRLHNTQEKLASGSRINKSADDAAGLGISTQLEADVRSVRQSLRNTQDGVSLLQTAEGGINEINNILIRLRELSIQAASDTVGNRERGMINMEFQQITDEVTRIANATVFNGTQLLNGQGGNLTIQIGAQNVNWDQFVFRAGGADVRAEKLGIEGLDILTKEQAQRNLEYLDRALTRIGDMRSGLGGFQNRFVTNIKNMTNFQENLTHGKSRIRDADVAEETANLAKEKVLMNSGVSVLLQANQNSSLALQLLS